MRPSSFFVCAGAAAAGVALGHFARPAASPPPPSVPPAAATKAEPAARETPQPSGLRPTDELVTTDEALAYLAKLEKLSASQVCQELRTLNYSGTLRKELASTRFLQFPATQRLKALLEPPPKGASLHVGAWNDLYLKTAAEMILTDPAAVAKFLNDQFVGQFDGIGPVLEPLLARDGWEAALDFLGKLPPRAQAEAKPRLTALLAAQDLPKAQAECLKVPEGKDRNVLLSAVAKVMADSDPKAALEWAGRHFKSVEHEMGHRPQNVTADILGKVMAKDPAAGAALLAENQSAFSSNYGGTEVGELFSSWAARDFKAAEAWLNANPLGDDLQRTTIASIYTQRLDSLKDGAGALSFYQNLSSDLQADCADTLLRKVGVKGLPGGLDEFYKGLSPRGRNGFESELRLMMPNLSTEERKQALAIISKSGDVRAGMSYMLDSALDQVPEEERGELLASLGGPMRDELQAKQAREALQSGDLEKAQTLLRGLTGATKDVLPQSELAVSLADTDPAAAIAWVESLPEGKTRSTAAVNLAANWAKSDLASAAEWARNLPPENGRDDALQEIIKVQGLTGEVRPALELAATIRDESARLTAIAAATRSAWFQNPADARQLLAGQNLSPGQIEKVIDRIETGNSR